MRQNRSLVEKISITDSVPSRSQKKSQIKSVQPRDINVVQNAQSLDELHSINETQKKSLSNLYKQQNEQSQQDQQQPSKNLEQSIMIDLKNNLSQISASVSNIKSQYTSLRQSQSQILLTTKTAKNKIKKLHKLDHPQIVSFLEKKQQQQQLRQKRRLQDISQLQQKKAESQEQRQKEKEMAKIQRMTQIKKMSYVKDKNQIRKQQQAMKQKQVEQIYKKYRDSIPLFEIKQKQSKEDQSKRAQIVKQYLKKHKQTYMSVNQPYQQKQLIEHNRRHQQKKQKKQKEFNEQKNQILQKIQTDNEALRNLYRGKVTERVIEEIRMEQQKRQIPYRIRDRIKGYEDFVKQNYKPKQTKSHQGKTRSNSSSLDLKMKRINDSHLSFREIKRYKYLHGVSFGQIIEQRPMAKSFQEEKRVGNGYLQYMKSLPKKREQKYIEPLIMPIQRSPRPNPLLHNRPRNPLINIKDEPTRDEINMVLEQLRLNDRKIKDRQKIAAMKGSHHEENDQDRREINDDILLSVEKKINLLHKLEKNKIPLKH